MCACKGKKSQNKGMKIRMIEIDKDDWANSHEDWLVIFKMLGQHFQDPRSVKELHM